MIIFFVGLPGTGKTSLATKVSQELNIPHYDMDSLKARMYPLLDPLYQEKLDNNIPISNAVRKTVFKEAVKDFNRLSKLHKHLIVDDVLHERVTREILFKGGEKYFGESLIIWIRPPSEMVKKRLSDHERKEHLLKDPWGMHLVFKEKFETFKNPHIVFENNEELSKSVPKLLSLIRRVLI